MNSFLRKLCNANHLFSVLKIAMQMVELVLIHISNFSICSHYQMTGSPAFVDSATSFMIIKHWA